ARIRPMFFASSGSGRASPATPDYGTASLPRGSQLVEREATITEENAQHHHRRDEIAAEDGPRLEHVEQPRAEDHHGREDRDLEAAEEREDPEEQVSIALGDGEEAGNRQAEGDEGDPWTAVYLKTRPGVIVSAAGSRR